MSDVPGDHFNHDSKMVHNNGGELRGHGSMTGVAYAECAPRPATIQTVAGIGPVPHLAARTPRRWEATPSACSASRCRSSPGLILRSLLPELDVRWRPRGPRAPPDAGGTRARAARHSAHRRVLPPGARPQGALLANGPGPLAAGTAAPRCDHQGRGQRWLQADGIAAFNRRFAVPAAQAGTAFVPPPTGLTRVFTIQHERTVSNANTVQFHRRVLQIGATPLRCHFVRCRVTVHEHLDETLSITYGPHTIARFTRDGEPVAITAAA